MRVRTTRHALKNTYEQAIRRFTSQQKEGPNPKVHVDQERRLITVSPEDPSRHSASCIFMHGLGDTAHGWSDLCCAIAAENPHLRFVLPTAPTTRVSMNGGMPMPSWFDIHGLDRLQEPCDGLDRSAEYIRKLLAVEERAVGSERCVLAGFSQGGALALWVGIQLPHQLAGILAMSAFLPNAAAVVPSLQASETRILQCHGEDDAMVRINFAREVETLLDAHGFKRRKFRSYDGLGHAQNRQEIRHVRKWFRKVLPDRS